MRGALQLAMAVLAAGAVVVVGFLATRTPAPEPRARAAPRAAEPALRERLVADLAVRLGADPQGRRDAGRPAPRTEADALAAARRLQRGTCRRGSLEDQCHEAVASAAVRRLWRSMRRPGRHRQEAAVLIGVGAGLRLRGDEVVNAVRAEFDAQLTRAVRSGTLARRSYRRALACFDDPALCHGATS